MDPYVAALAIGAVVVALMLRHDRRAVAWVVAGAVAFAVTYIYAVAGGWRPPVIKTLVDAGLCLGVYIFGCYRWEMLLWRVYQASILISIMHLFGAVPDHTSYIIGLEACNWAALFVIGTGGLSRTIVDVVDPWRPVPPLRRALGALRAQRAHPPGWHR